MTSVPPPRIAPVDPPYSAELAATLARWMPPGAAIEPLRLFRTLARSPLLFERMRPLGSALLNRGTLPPRNRELVILRTSARCGAEYEWGVHAAAFAAAVGLDDGDLAATTAPIAARPLLAAVDELLDHATW